LSRRSLTEEVTITIGANAALALLALATGTIAARLLGPAGRGELAAIQMWASFAAVLATMGLPEAVTFFCARDPEHAARHTGSAVAMGLLGCAPILALGYLAMPLLLGAQTAAVIGMARRYLLIALLFIIIGGPHGALRGLSDFGAWNALRFAPGAIWMGVLCGAWALGRATPEFVAGLNLAALGIIGTPVVLYVFRRRVKGSMRPDPRSWWPMLRFGLPSATSAVPQNLNLRLDQMLMAAILAPRLLGLYVVAVAWSGMMSPLLQAFGAVLFPHVASHDSAEARARAFVRVVRLAAPLAVILAAAVALATPWGLPLVFGHAYADSIPPALVLVIAGAILSLDRLLEEGFRGLGYPAGIMWSEFGGLAATAVSLLCMLKPMGIMGAAVSSVLGYGTVGALLLVQARRITGYPAAEMLVPSRREMHQGWTRIASLVWRQA
jgi:O-antigen/teichoic acid export membrane protein